MACLEIDSNFELCWASIVAWPSDEIQKIKIAEKELQSFGKSCTTFARRLKALEREARKVGETRTPAYTKAVSEAEEAVNAFQARYPEAVWQAQVIESLLK